MNDDTDSRSDRGPTRLTILLWASAMGTYLLVALGGVTSLLDGGACSRWPFCRVASLDALADAAIVVPIGHRVASLVVGLVLLATVGTACRERRDRVTATVLLAAVLYPVQVALGARIVAGETTVTPAVHLVLGIAIFALALLALLWQLDRTTASATTSDPTSTLTRPTRPTPPTTDAESASNPTTDAESASNPTTDAESASNPTTDAESAGNAGKPPDSPDAAATEDGNGASVAATWRTRLWAYLELTKPRLMWLLCLLAVATMALAAGRELPLKTAAATTFGGMLAVGASGTFNNVLERDLDEQMDRTDDRPLVDGRISVSRAVAFGVALTALSIVVFVAFVNVLAAVLALGAIGFYSVVYTLILKPHTRQNVVLGGAVGAFPALIGWAAVENEIGLPALALGVVVFLWTPAHFYNLALAYQDDYAAAGFPMLPVVSGGATTRRHILRYLGATLVGSVLLGVATRLEWVYALAIVLLGGVFLWTVLELFHEQTDAAAFRAFHASNAYLGGLLLAILVDTLLV